ncbi:MAG: alpha/beta hydrolase family protein [Isosphaeraceae bacterium]
MSVRWLIRVAALVIVSLAPAIAQDAPKNANIPLPGEALGRHLLDQAAQHFKARRQAIAAIKTSEAIVQRQKAMRDFLLGSLGDLPERSPLNAKVVGSLTSSGYRIDKVIFESRLDHHVTANLYLPEGKGPFPGILVPCGHSDNGKAYSDYQRASILLARNGMAVLCYDPIGQGERFQLLDKDGKPVVRGTTEHTMAGIGALLVGRQLASYRIWDAMRALDYLAGRPEVDRDRLGCTGNSGGGTLTSYLMALDDRIKVAAPSCFITSLERLFATIGPQDAEQNITGDVAAGFEHADFITARAPRPTLLTVGTRDFFDIQGSWDTFREVKLIYGRLGFGERVDLFESDELHGFTRPRRVATARWFKRWLLKQDEAVDEPDAPIATDAELQCTRTGQVMRDFQDVSVFDLNRQKERSLAAARPTANQGRSEADFRDEVKARIGLGDWKATPLRPRVITITPGSGFSMRQLVFDVEPGLSLPAIDLRRDGATSSGPAIVKLGVDWKEELPPGNGGDKLTSTVSRIILVDPRGMGATTPTTAAGRKSPFGPDWQEGYLALHLARPLLGQRVADLLRILAGLDAESPQDARAGFQVIGVGNAGPIVLHAAFLDKGALIRSAAAEHSLYSWSLLIQKALSRDQLANVVPGVLELYDLPDLARRLGRRMRIRTPADAMGEPVPDDFLRQPS